MTASAAARGPVVTLGETLALIHTNSPGPLAYSESLMLGSGGAESNVAIALTRLGTDVTWLGRVGQDSLGDRVVADIRGEGVTTLALRDDAAPTALMLKERRTNAYTAVWYYRAGSAGSRLKPADIPPGLIESAALVHLSGITPALSETARETFFTAISRARDARVPVSLDLNYRGRLWSPTEAGDIYRRAIPLVDIVFGSDDEAAMAVGEGTPQELAERLVTMGAREAVIKLGAEGCVANIGGTYHSRPAVSITVVDSVGAGDAFVAGYLSEWLRNSGVDDRLTTAVTAGAFACLVPGDWEGMPRRNELAILDPTDPVSR
jgi:2-dehydro-3-deoxygluconokinase